MRLRSLALIGAVSVAAIGTAAAQSTSSSKVTAWISTTVEPGSTQKVSFYVWNATAFEVAEYRVADADVASSLRESGVQFDTAGKTPTRRVTFTGQQGDLQVAAAPGLYVHVAKATAGSNAAGGQAQAGLGRPPPPAGERGDPTPPALPYPSKTRPPIPHPH